MFWSVINPDPTKRKINMNRFAPIIKYLITIVICLLPCGLFAYEMDDLTKLAAIHASPWKYDTYVPLFFVGHGIPAQRIARPVTPYDIAATLAAYLNIKPPSGSVGVPLVKVLNGK